MRNVKIALAILSVAAALAPAANAAQPGDSNGKAAAPAANGVPLGGPAYGAPGYVGPYAYGPVYGPSYGPGFGGGPWGHGGGSGRVRVSFDFDGLADGWMPWRGWWW